MRESVSVPQKQGGLKAEVGIGQRSALPCCEPEFVRRE